jgi:hypothetical protein
MSGSHIGWIGQQDGTVSAAPLRIAEAAGRLREDGTFSVEKRLHRQFSVEIIGINDTRA